MRKRTFSLWLSIFRIFSSFGKFARVNFVILIFWLIPSAISATVTVTGGYSYQIPILIPPSLENMGPQELALTYSNGGGIGIAGVGWNISGIPMITRAKGMNYTTNDRFIIGGSELVDTVGGRMSFRSETEPLVEYIPIYGECGFSPTEPCSWEAHTPGGGILYFGTTNNSKAEAQGRSAYRVWALEKVQNAAGLYYTIEYIEAGGELYPSRIVYTYGPNTSHYRRITFNYSDVNQSGVLYSGAAPTQMTKLLSGIDVSIDYTCVDLFITTICVGGNNFRSYQFQYDQGPSSGRTRLISFMELDESGAILPISAAFTYQENILSVENKVWHANTIGYMGYGGASTNDFVTIAGDFNGDGITDLATLPSGGIPADWPNWIAVELSTGSGFSSKTWASTAVQTMRFTGVAPANCAIIPGDFNGDGKTDLAFIARSSIGPGDFWYSSIIIEYSTGNGFSSKTVNTALGKHMYDGFGGTADYSMMPVELNANGLTDIAIFRRSEDGLNIWADNFIVLLSAGNLGFDTQVWHANAARYMASVGSKTSDFQIVAGDFNGDGKTDFAFAAKQGSVWASAFPVELSTGTGFSSQLWNTQTAIDLGSDTDAGPISDYRFVTGDFNGDGKTDLATIRIPDYVPGTCPSPPCEPTNWRLPPAVQNSWYTSIHIDFATGSGFDSQVWDAAAPAQIWRSGGKNTKYNVLVSDLNQDGLSDLIFVHGARDPSEPWAASYLTETSTGSAFRSGSKSSQIASEIAQWKHGGAYRGHTLPNYYLMAGDFNGDAISDLMLFSIVQRDDDPSSVLTEMSTGSLPDQLIAVQNTLGIREEVTYKVSAQMPGAINPMMGRGYPYLSNTIPQNLVQQIKVLGDGKTQKQITYAYTEGLIYLANTGRHKPMGFATVTETDQMTGRYKVSQYYRTASYPMQPQSVYAYLADGTPLMWESYDPPMLCKEANCDLIVSDMPWFDNNPWPRVMRQTSYVRRAYNTPFTIVYARTVKEYDKFSNPTVIEEVNGGVPTTTYTWYQNDPDRGLYGLVTEKRICKGQYQDANAVCRPGYVPGLADWSNTQPDDAGLISWERFAYEMQIASSLGKLTQQYTYIGTDNQIRRWDRRNFRYDPSTGQLTAVFDMTKSTYYTYDYNFGQYPINTFTYSLNNDITYVNSAFDPRFGKQISSADERGMVTVSSLDTRGRETEKKVFDNHGRLLRRATAQYTESIGGNRVDTCQYYGDSFDKTDCSRTLTDSFGREIYKIAQSATGADNHPIYVATKTEYDSQWRKSKVSLPYESDMNGNGSPDKWIVNSYDSLDRITSVTTPDGRQTITRYNNLDFFNCAGNNANPCSVPTGTTLLQSVVDPVGKRKDTYSNYLGKPIKIVDGVGTSRETVTTYEYFVNGKLYRVNAPQGTTTIGYNFAGQRTSISDPNLGSTAFFYDYSGLESGETISGSFGRVTREFRNPPGSPLATSDPNSGGSNIVYNYDSWGRVTLKITSSAAGTSTTGYVYDESSASFGTGRLTSVTYRDDLGVVAEKRPDAYLQQSGITKKLSYDILGNLVGVATDVGLADGSVDHLSTPLHTLSGNTYDQLGRKTEILYPDMKKTKITYLGGASMISDIVHDGVSYAQYSDFTITGQAQAVKYGNGVIAGYSYDSQTLRLSNLQIKDKNSKSVQDLDYAFDDSNNIASIADNVNSNASYTYKYDALNRLSEAARGDGKIFRYDFDTSGNLTQKENRRNFFQPGTTQLDRSELNLGTDTATTTFTYAPNGNLTNKATPNGSIGFIYSPANMLLYAAQTGGALDGTAVEMLYDEGGQRYLKRFLPKLGNDGVATATNPEIRTWYLGGMEIREKWSYSTGIGIRRSDIQQSKIIFGASNERLAMVTSAVSSQHIAYSLTSEYWFAQANLKSGQSSIGIALKIGNNFMGCYYLTNEFYRYWKKELIIALLAMAVGLFLWLTMPSHLKRNVSSLWRIRNFSYRTVAILMVVAFVSVNCSGGNSDLQNSAYAPPTDGPSGSGPGDTPVWDPLLSGIPAGTYFYHGNHLQSATLITNDKGTEELRIHYLPYGEIDQNLSGKWNPDTQAIEHNPTDTVVASQAARYTDQDLDIETSLMYFKARYVDPAIGVFTTPDTMVPDETDGQSFNRYSYVRGNPVKYVDPSGHAFGADDILEILAIAAIGAAIGGVLAGTGGDIAGWISGTTKFDWDSAWKGALAGALAGAAGAYVGMAVAGLASAGTGGLSVAFGVGLTAGYVGGFVGEATGAWMNGSGFWDGFTQGMLAGDIGAAAGGLLAMAGYGLATLVNGQGKGGGEGFVNGEGTGFVTKDGKNYCPPQNDDLCAMIIPEKHPQFGELHGGGGPTLLPRERSKISYYFKDVENDYADHSGIDMKADWGEPLFAVANGKAYYGYNRPMGTYLRLVHEDGRFSTYYAHLNVFSIVDGESVSAGQMIGRVGCNGKCSGPHIHFSVINRRLGVFVNPLTGGLD